MEWTGLPYAHSYEEMMALFDEAVYPDAFYFANRLDEAACVKEERAFWLRFYACKLRRAGLVEGVDEKAALLHELTWLKGIVPYPETEKTLAWFYERGYKLGVISDTSPSLRLTFEAAGLGKYFSSYTCSALVGVMKPDPLIYRTALESLGVSAKEALYVDDYVVESDGARAIGMTAFHILREGLDRGYEGEREWDIHSLYEMAEFVQNAK